MWKRIFFSDIKNYISTAPSVFNYVTIQNYFRRSMQSTQSSMHDDNININFLKNNIFLLLSFYLSITFFKLIAPSIINQLISSFNSVGATAINWQWSLYWGSLLVISQILNSLIGQHYIFKTNVICQEISSLFNKQIFDKTLHSKTPLLDGEVINRSLQDSENASNLIWILSELILAVLTICVSSLCLIYFLGIAAVPSLAMLFMIIPLGRFFSKRFTIFQSRIQYSKDLRLEAISAHFNDLEGIKSNQWHDVVFREIKKNRKREIYFWKKININKAKSTFLFLAINIVVAASAFALFIMLGGELTSELAFTSLCYFGFLDPALKQLSKLNIDLANSNNAAKRINEFLKSDSIPSPDSKIELKTNSTAIVGELGVGKSTLLGQFLSLKDKKVIGYCPQEPFLFTGSLYENITLGKSIDISRIEKSLVVSGLSKDLYFLVEGLSTYIANEGKLLSFAQKQQITLARLYCMDPDVLILDEPCSSLRTYLVDSIFRDLFFGEWANKKKIIVTHQTRFLSEFEEVIFIDKSNTLHIGKYSELLSNSEFSIFCDQAPKYISKKLELGSIPDLKLDHFESLAVEDSEYDTNRTGAYTYLLDAISQFRGSKYKVLSLLILLVSSLLIVFLPILQNYYVAEWTDTYGGVVWALGYLFIGIILSLVSGTGAYIWATKLFGASSSMHDSALTSILRSSDRSPKDETELVNLFSKDLDTLEKDLPFYSEDATNSLLNTLSSSLVLILTLPIVFVAFLPLALAVYYFTSIYKRYLCRIKDLISRARTPRIRSMSVTLKGQDVIQSFNAQRFFMDKMQSAFNQYQDVLCFQTAMSRWFIIRISILGCLFSLIVIGLCTYSISNLLMTKAIASMMVLYSFKLWENLCWSVKSVNEADAQMVFVNRFKKYSELSLEKSSSSFEPVDAHLEFDKIVYYSQKGSYYSLDSLSEKINRGEKVGVLSLSNVSRFAFMSLISGKSTMHSGHFKIGDNYSSEVDPYKAFSFVNESAPIFSGTLKFNLDPLGQYSDDELSEAVEFIGLEVPLNHLIASGGHNLSYGQRRLLILTRGILNKNKIIVIEGTHPSSNEVIFERALKKILTLKNRTIIVVSDDENHLEYCDRTFKIGHRLDRGSDLAS